MKNTTKKIDWIVGSGDSSWKRGYKHDFSAEPMSDKYPDVGSVEYVAVGAAGKVLFRERRAMHRDEAAKLGLA